MEPVPIFVALTWRSKPEPGTERVMPPRLTESDVPPFKVPATIELPGSKVVLAKDCERTPEVA